LQVVTLAFEPGEPGVLRRPPRSPRESIFNRLMIERLVVSSLVSGGVCLEAFWWMVHVGWAIEEARNALLLLMVLFENVEVGNARSETRSALGISPLRNGLLLSSVVAAMALHLVAMHFAPLQHVLGTAPVDARTWITLGLLSLLLHVATEVHKLSWWLRARRRRQGQRHRRGPHTLASG
jgi:magnesium-transporting ATPase (P-type)